MHTNAEWKSIVEEVAKGVKPLDTPRPAISCSTLSAPTLAKTIDHTLLKLDATPSQVSGLCKEAREHDFAAVCVRANFVALAVSQLKVAPSVNVACVVGFHEGTQSTACKVAEAQKAVADGAAELDVVLDREMLRAGDLEGVYEQLRSIREVSNTATLKLILETSQLETQEVVAAATIAGYAGFEFIKTSTGFCGRGAIVHDVVLMGNVAEVVSKKLGRGKMKVKASGGVRSFGESKAMLEAGAERIGTSSGVKIMKEFRDEDCEAAGVQSNDY